MRLLIDIYKKIFYNKYIKIKSMEKKCMSIIETILDSIDELNKATEAYNTG